MAGRNVDIGKLINEETEKRLNEMAKPEYQFPPKATKKDAIAIILIAAVCVVLIICCMAGVIE